MTIGIIVEGQKESQSLAYIVSKITIEGVTIRKPLYAPIEPKATPAQIAKAVESRLKILGKVSRILLLIDLENLDVCPGERAQALERAVFGMGYAEVYVVVKNRKFENWLIADCDALKQLNAFNPTASFIRQVNGKAEGMFNEVCHFLSS